MKMRNFYLVIAALVITATWESCSKQSETDLQSGSTASMSSSFNKQKWMNESNEFSKMCQTLKGYVDKKDIAAAKTLVKNQFPQADSLLIWGDNSGTVYNLFSGKKIVHSLSFQGAVPQGMTEQQRKEYVRKEAMKMKCLMTLRLKD